MRSKATARFWARDGRLPPRTQRLAEKTYRLWRRDPSHPSLHFKKLHGTPDLFSVRVGDHHRAVGLRKGDLVIWVWIGTHQEYDSLLWR
jgi:hypothetical protein